MNVEAEVEGSVPRAETNAATGTESVLREGLAHPYHRFSSSDDDDDDSEYQSEGFEDSESE